MKNTLRKIFCFSASSILSFLILGTVFGTTVNADYTIDNDGNPRDEEDVCGDSGLPSSYDGADYYDCYIPYNLTFEDIGGYATGVLWYEYSSYNTPEGMPTYLRNNHVGTAFMIENENLNNFIRYPVQFDRVDPETTMLIYKDQYGNEYYSCAVPEAMYRSEKVGTNNFPGYSMENRCQMLDVILSDGTVIHFIIGDAAAIQHCNAGADDPAAKFDVEYVFSEINYPQYRHIFHAVGGHFIELNGYSLTEFTSKYNIGDAEGQNHVVYVRMYNQNVNDAGHADRAEGVGKEVSYNLGDLSVDASSSGSSNDSSANGETGGVSDFVLGLDQLPGMSSYDLQAQQDNIEFADGNNLSTGEKYSIASLREDIALSRESNIIDIARTAVVFCGLVMITYMVLLILAWLFDKSNNFIDMSLVRVLTLGKLEYTEDKEIQHTKGYANNTRIFIISSVLAIIGMILISGGVFPWMMRILMTIVNKLT